MSFSRRSFLQNLFAGAAVAGQEWKPAPAVTPPGPRPVLVETPDLPKLPFTIDRGVKVFRLVAEPVKTTFMPGRPVDCWGFNGSMPGPAIEVTQGDRVRIIVENRLPEIFSAHWHGLEVPPEVDGVPGLGIDPIPPGGSRTFEFSLHQHGTFFYHSHMPMQEMMGMIGLFIVHPPQAYEPRVHRDFGLIWQGWSIRPNNTVPNTLAMEFNWLTINGKAGPDTTPMIVKTGERVRIRMVNLSMDHHPIHLHGNTFYTVGTEAGRIPQPWEPGNTVIVGVAQARDIEFDAVYPGDWMLHCHLPHHMMNQMGSSIRGDVVPNYPLGEHAAMGHTAHPSMPAAPPEAWTVKGYPQDMWMVMDDAIAAKPENLGLRPGWSAAMMGMMTLVRVVDPPAFDRIQALKAGQQKGGR